MVSERAEFASGPADGHPLPDFLPGFRVALVGTRTRSPYACGPRRAWLRGDDPATTAKGLELSISSRVCGVSLPCAPARWVEKVFPARPEALTDARDAEDRTAGSPTLGLNPCEGAAVPDHAASRNWYVPARLLHTYRPVPGFAHAWRSPPRPDGLVQSAGAKDRFRRRPHRAASPAPASARMASAGPGRPWVRTNRSVARALVTRSWSGGDACV